MISFRCLSALGGLLAASALFTAEASAQVYVQTHNLPRQTGATLASREYSHAEVSEDLENYRFNQAEGVARIGHLGVFAESEIRGEWNTGTLAQAGFEDTLTINAAGLTGTNGSFIAKMWVSGVLQADASTNATIYTGKSETSFSALLGGNGAYATLDGTYMRSNDATSFVYYGDIPGLMEVEVSFIFGTPFTLSGQLTVETHAEGNLAFNDVWAWSRAEFGHTAYVEGVEEVFTENDEAVGGFTITSLSGADYIEGFENAAIPEPATAVMIAGALALAAAVARRRGRGRGVEIN